MSASTVKAITPWVAFGLQAASEMGAARLQLPEIALEAPRDESGAPTNEPGEADILALLPSRLLAKTALGKQLAKVLLDEEQKATLAVLVAYGLRVGPAVIERVRENNVARRQNAQPRRVTPSQGQPVTPADGGIRPAIIPVPGSRSNGRGAAANGAGDDGASFAIPVPHI